VRKESKKKVSKINRKCERIEKHPKILRKQRDNVNILFSQDNQNFTATHETVGRKEGEMEKKFPTLSFELGDWLRFPVLHLTKKKN
jgi:hypothetical protein